MTADNLLTALQAIDAFNASDRDGFRSLFLDDPSVVPFTAADNGSTPDTDSAWARFWSYLDEGWDGLAIVHDETHFEENEVAVIGALRATPKGDPEPVASAASFLFSFREEKITGLQIKIAGWAYDGP